MYKIILKGGEKEESKLLQLSENDKLIVVRKKLGLKTSYQFCDRNDATVEESDISEMTVSEYCQSISQQPKTIYLIWPENIELKHLDESFTAFKPQDLTKVNLGSMIISKTDKIKELTPQEQLSLLENINFLSGYDLENGNLKVKKKVFVIKKNPDILNAFYHDDGVLNTKF